jgi:hypothetical protein
MKNNRSNNRRVVLSIFKSYLFLLMGVTIISCSLQSIVPADPLVMTPEEVVESFYNWLIEYPGNPRVDGAFKNSPFLSESYIQKVDEDIKLSVNQLGGADPFFCAQDIPDKVYVNSAEIDNGRASVRLTTSFVNHRLLIELNLIDGEWKIVKINCLR